MAAQNATTRAKLKEESLHDREKGILKGLRPLSRVQGQRPCDSVVSYSKQAYDFHID